MKYIEIKDINELKVGEKVKLNCYSEWDNLIGTVDEIIEINGEKVVFIFCVILPTYRYEIRQWNLKDISLVVE